MQDAISLLKEAEREIFRLQDAWVSTKESDALRKKIRKFVAAQQSAQADVCPECKCGDGLHEDDCSIAADMVIKSFHA